MDAIILCDEFEYRFLNRTDDYDPENGDDFYLNTASADGIGFGICVISDAVKCTVKEELRGNYELQMEYPVTGRHFSDLIERRILYARANPYDIFPQPFRIYSITKSVKGTVTVRAAHISYDLNGYICRELNQAEAQGGYIPTVVIDCLNDSFPDMQFVYPAKRTAQNPHGRLDFHFGIDAITPEQKFSTDHPMPVKQLLADGKDSFIEKYDLEPKFDGLNVYFYKRRGVNRNARIEYGKDLSDLSQELNCEEAYTALYPYAKQNYGTSDSGGTDGELGGDGTSIYGDETSDQNDTINLFRPTIIDAEYTDSQSGVHYGKLVKPKMYGFQILGTIQSEDPLKYSLVQNLWTKYTDRGITGIVYSYTPNPELGDSLYFPRTEHGMTSYDRVGYITRSSGASSALYSADIGFCGISFDIVRNSNIVFEPSFSWEKVLPIDLSEYFESGTITPYMIRAKAEQYLTFYHIAEPKVSTTVSFTDLRKTTEYEQYQRIEETCVGDTITVTFPKLGISTATRVTAAEYDVLTGKYISLTLGERKKDISDEILRVKRDERDNLNSYQNTVAQVVDTMQFNYVSLTNQIMTFLQDIGFVPRNFASRVDFTKIVDGINLIPTASGDYTKITGEMVSTPVELLDQIHDIEEDNQNIFATLDVIDGAIAALEAAVSALQNNSGGNTGGGGDNPGGGDDPDPCGSDCSCNSDNPCDCDGTSPCDCDSACGSDNPDPCDCDGTCGSDSPDPCGCDSPCDCDAPAQCDCDGTCGCN